MSDKKVDYPPMVGKGEMEASQEIHIFLLPLNPDAETVEGYRVAVEKWNKTVLPGLKNEGHRAEAMKACHLALVFRQGGEEKTVQVMQSARYVRSNDPSWVIEQAHQDAQWFRDHGFEVVREKIEATAYGIEGIPQTDEEALQYPKYFEFHLKVQRKDRDDQNLVTPAEIAELKAIAIQFSQEYGVPVPLSYNHAKGYQRFLNLRFRGQGINTIKDKVKAVEQKIAKETSFQPVKTISEYVWYDTYTEMDHGWIDFSPEEFKTAFLKDKAASVEES